MSEAPSEQALTAQMLQLKAAYLIPCVYHFLCRTGERFGFEHAALEPDILVLCKALANGLPIGAFMATDAVAEKYTRPGASTFGGNLVCATAARATLAFMRAERLERQARLRGDQLRGRLEWLAARHALIAEVRGRGLMLGLELTDDNGAAAASATDRILEGLKGRGVLAGKTGPERNVLTLMPPLVISQEEIEELSAALTAVFAEVAD